MRCERALELISARVDGEITFVDDEALRLHLEECRRCWKRLEAVRRQDQALARAFAAEREAAATLADRIVAHLATHDPAIRPRCTILVVDDRVKELSWMETALSEEYDVLLADSAAAAQELFRHRGIDLILSDQQMPGMTGVQLLEWVFQHYPRTMRLLMTSYDEVDAAVEAFNRGHLFRYLQHPFGLEGLLATVGDAARTFQLERNHEHVLKELRTLNNELELRVAQRTRQLEAVNTELEQKNLMLEKFALNDALTGLPNRRALDYLMERELRWRERYHAPPIVGMVDPTEGCGRRSRDRERCPAPLTVGIVDVDHFKTINTEHLHSGGDEVLVQLARCLTNGLRKIDMLGRMGGEEFLLIAPQTNQAGARVLAERLRSEVEAAVFTYGGKVIPVRVSIGLAVVELGVPAEYQQVKLAAEAALKRAKALGRNRVEVEVLVPDATGPSAAGTGAASA